MGVYGDRPKRINVITRENVYIDVRYIRVLLYLLFISDCLKLNKEEKKLKKKIIMRVEPPLISFNQVGGCSG